MNFNPYTSIILPWLLHHANREGKDEYFYAIKNRILKRYGKHDCYDVQFIEGKKCNTCGGTGVFVHFSGDEDECDRCGGDGWYRLPVWNILAKISFGRYTFHQPYQRSYMKPDTSIQIIEGYIDHDRSKHGRFAKSALFLLYEKGYLKRWYKSVGMGWRLYWWLPRNYLPNLIHFIKHGKNSYPFRKREKPIPYVYQPVECDGDLPF